jgi:hypothetical protein
MKLHQKIIFSLMFLLIYLSASYRGEELERATKPEKALEIA